MERYPWEGLSGYVEIDVSEWVDDMLLGWTVEERTRWEGEGGFILDDRLWWGGS